MHEITFLNTLLVFLPAGANAEVRSVTLLTNETVHIKPCMPVYGVLDVRFDKAPTRKEKAEIVEALSAQVVLNDTNYGRAGMGNSVAAFEWAPDAAGDKDIETNGGRVLVLLFVRIPEKEFLFQNPGTYDFRFFADVKLRVIVDEPVSNEEVLIKRIRELGMPLALFFIEPQSQHPHIDLSAVEEIVKLGPSTDYGKLLRRCLAINKLSSSYWHERGREVDREEMWKERLRFVQEQFGDAASRPIETMIDATSAYILGRELIEAGENQVRARDGMDPLRLIESGIALLERVNTSPLADKHREQIRQRLSAVHSP